MGGGGGAAAAAAIGQLWCACTRAVTTFAAAAGRAGHCLPAAGALQRADGGRDQGGGEEGEGGGWGGFPPLALPPPS